MIRTDSESFVRNFQRMSLDVHEIAQEKGWHKEKRNDGELIALIHSELSECLEGLRVGNPLYGELPDHFGIPAPLSEFKASEVELADVVIRIMDMSASRGWDVGAAIVAKVNFNRSRPHMHGGKKF